MNNRNKRGPMSIVVINYENQNVYITIIITILLIGYYPLFSNFINSDGLEMLQSEPIQTDDILALPHQWTFLSTWDDDGNFLENEMIHKLDFKHLQQMFMAVRINVWEPLGWIMKAVVYNFCGLSSIANRIAAFLLHTVNTLLLRELIDWVLKKRFNARCGNSSLVGALFFGIHPLNVEVIGWPSANPYTLSCTFSIISLLYYTKHVDYNYYSSINTNNTKDNNNSTSYFYLYISTIFYFFAVMSKGVALTIPIAILAIDCALLNRQYLQNNAIGDLFKDLVIHCLKRVIYAIAVIIAFFATVMANMDGTNPMLDTIKLTTAQRIMKAFSCFTFFIGKIIYPASLHAHYQVHEWKLDVNNVSNDVLISIIFICIITCICIVKLKSNPELFGFWLYFIVMMLPVTGIIQHGMIAMGGDRYMYLPMLGVSVMISFIYHSNLVHNNDMDDLIENEEKDEDINIMENQEVEEDDSDDNERIYSNVRSMPKSINTICFSVLILYIVLTKRQIGTWHNDITLWTHNTKQDPTDWRSMDQLVEFYVKKNYVDHAIPFFDRIEWYSPQDGLKAALHMAKFSILKGKTMEACQRYQEAAEKFSNNAALYNNLGVCALQKDNRKVGMEMFTKALEYAVIAREKRTITHNINTLKDNMENNPDGSKRYRGSHSLIF